MLVGVISDTHNNTKNIKKIIYLLNKEKVDIVIHTGDISKSQTVRMFSELNCELMGVFGNNDRIEHDLQKVCSEYNFKFQEPPMLITLEGISFAVFHEPELIKDYTENLKDFDVILHGHTHRYREEIIDGTIYFNPGESAGMMPGKNALGIIDLKNLKIKRIFF